MPRINVTSVFVDDQDKALAFYTEMLGFIPKRDVPAGEYRWLTLVGDDQDGTELLLEPNAHPAAQAYQKALKADGIPVTQFEVADVTAVHDVLVAKGVTFTQPPVAMGPVNTVILDDTCGNLIQLATPAPEV